MNGTSLVLLTAFLRNIENLTLIKNDLEYKIGLLGEEVQGGLQNGQLVTEISKLKEEIETLKRFIDHNNGLIRLLQAN